jgi:thiamine biosynthesis lipoprotein
MIRRTWLQMGMPVTVCIQDDQGGPADIAAVYALFDAIDRRFSPYRADSEVSRLNAGEFSRDDISAELASILARCAQTKAETGGYFDPERDGRIDPSGLVKGWAIERASDLLASRGLGNYVVDAGGDVRAVGRNGAGQPWRVGIRNPFNRDEIIKILEIDDGGVATSGTAVRGSHIYNPWRPDPLEGDLVSLTIVGPTTYDADRFATAAFAMGQGGVAFIAERPELEAYAVTAGGRAIRTEGFVRYVR